MWVFIAYDPQEIIQFLASRGATVESISKLYFAQQVADKFMTPVLLDKDEVLSNIQHTATVTPRMLLSERVQCQGFSDAFKPSEGVTFSAGSNSIFESREAWIISSIFILFGLMFAAEGVRYRQATVAMQEKVAVLLKEYPALQSQYARDNIETKYQRIDQEERHKREILKDLSRLVFPGVEVETLSLGGKQFLLVLQCPDEKTLQRVESQAKSKGYTVRRTGSKKQITIEGKI